MRLAEAKLANGERIEAYKKAMKAAYYSLVFGEPKWAIKSIELARQHYSALPRTVSALQHFEFRTQAALDETKLLARALTNVLPLQADFAKLRSDAINAKALSDAIDAALLNEEPKINRTTLNHLRTFLTHRWGDLNEALQTRESAKELTAHAAEIRTQLKEGIGAGAKIDTHLRVFGPSPIVHLDFTHENEEAHAQFDKAMLPIPAHKGYYYEKTREGNTSSLSIKANSG